MSSTSDRGPRKRRFEIESNPSREVVPPGGERRTPVATQSRRRRLDAQDAADAEVRPRLPVSLQPSLLVFLGALFVAVAWLGYQNPEGGFHQGMQAWPWDLFRADLDQGGAVVFAWDMYRAVALGGAVLVLLLLVLSLLRSSSGRGIAVGIAAALAMALFWKDLPAIHGGSTWALPIAAALLAGAVLGRDGRLGRSGPRWPLLALLLVVLGLLFFPLAATSPYTATAFDLLAPLRTTIESGASIGLDRLGSTDGIHAMGLALLLVYGLLTLVGVRGRWTVWIGPLLVLLTAVGPIAGRLLFDAPAAPEGTLDLIHRLGDPEWTMLLGVAVILIAALLSGAGLGGRWTVGAAGVGLGVLALVVTSRFFVAGLETSTGFSPFFAGASRAALWLGPGLGAFLAPIAGAVIDQAAPPDPDG